MSRVQPARGPRGEHVGGQLSSRHEPGRLCAQKKRSRPSEQDRPDIQRQRAAFQRTIRAINPERLVAIDEAGVNIAMGRSHAWVPRGQVYVEARPINRGDNLTLMGAVRIGGWVTLGTCWRAMTRPVFLQWVETQLAPRLRRGDVVLLDNLPAHKSPRVQQLVEARGASVRFLPPYSYDFNPIEAAWGLIKKRIRAHAPRNTQALRRTACAARFAVRPHHCRAWFRHAGYVNASEHRG